VSAVVASAQAKRRMNLGIRAGVDYARRPGRGHDHEPATAERLADPKELLARVLLHIPEPRRHVIRYYGAYSSVVRARRRREVRATAVPGSTGIREAHGADPGVDSDRGALRRRWAQLIRRIYEADPLVCPRCGEAMRIIAFVTSMGMGWAARPCGGRLGGMTRLAYPRKQPTGGRDGGCAQRTTCACRFLAARGLFGLGTKHTVDGWGLCETFAYSIAILPLTSAGTVSLTYPGR